MKARSDYEEAVNDVVDCLNEQIDKKLAPTDSDETLGTGPLDDEKVASMIANREATRRGLSQLEDDCSVCTPCKE